MSAEIILAIALVAMCAIFNFTMFQYVKEYRDKTNESISYTQNELFKLEDKVRKNQQSMDAILDLHKNRIRDVDYQFTAVTEALIAESKRQRDYNKSFAKSIRRVANLAREDKNAKSAKKK
ncbi:hypothetical protein [Lactobacillus intestinalis]|uniref:hypothetical protein n=1 Tax=Lactobacillus intestinalis TaxID=151781 RepID=UPI0002CC6194|nr:hypothetical protein [Lactobacillus intestinalis]KAI4308867.1 hypothetical protein C821_000538 [Lactobacillus intestinalis]